MKRRIKYMNWSAAAGAAVVLAAAGSWAAVVLHTSAHAVGSPQVVGEGNLELPLDAYHLSALQTGEQVNESNVLERACMKSYGITYLAGVPNITDKVAAGFAINDSRRYGVTDPAAAKKYGYHPPTPATPANTPANQPESLSPQQYLVLSGQTNKLPVAGHTAPAIVGRYNGKAIPRDGCMGVATQTLHAPDTSQAGQNARSLAANLQQEDFLKTQSSAQVHAAFRQWSTCMAAHGYHYANPIAAATDRRWNMKKSPARAEVQAATTAEVQAATTDVTCKQKTDLVSVEYRVETALQNTSIKQYARVLAPLKAMTAIQVTALQSAMTKYGK